ncbi:Cystatin/monellin superfamily protein [Raphanus sativus]|nr:Cystatin/monellin superfamily protein [Raphanus sativus]
MFPDSNDVAEVKEDVLTATKIADSSCLGKRKAEEDCESSMEETDDGGSDSNRDYFSFSEGELAEDFSDQEYLKPYLDYRRQIHLTRGFEVDPDSIPEDMITGYFPIDLNDTRFGWPKSPDGTARCYMERMVQMCLDKYNKTQGLDVKMDHVVRAIAMKSAGIKCYITFMAQEIPTGPLVEYQAKTEWKIRQVHTYPIFCRPSPPPVDLKDKARKSTRVRPRK